MPQITFYPLQKTIEAEHGETILEAALRENIPIQHACGGFCACTTCHIEVRKGFDNLSNMEEDESDRLDRMTHFTTLSRLACQTKVLGDVEVEIINLEPEL